MQKTTPFVDRSQFQWGIIGAGQIARVFCNAIRFSARSSLRAIASRSYSPLSSLSKDFFHPSVDTYRDYHDLLADPKIDAVYIATINRDHATCAIDAMKAGKHVLVEKPIAITRSSLRSMIEVSQSSKVALMEGFMYRFHPQLKRVKAVIADQQLGQILRIESTFAYQEIADPHHRVYQRRLGGGSLLDVGCYTVSMSRLLAQWALGPYYGEPRISDAHGVIGESGVDLYAEATLLFPEGLTATLCSSISHNAPPLVKVIGSRGELHLLDPWLPSSPCRFASTAVPTNTIIPPARLDLYLESESEGKSESKSKSKSKSKSEGERGSGIRRSMTIAADRDLFTLQIDAFSSLCDDFRQGQVALTESEHNLATLSEWASAIGIDFKAMK